MIENAGSKTNYGTCTKVTDRLYGMRSAIDKWLKRSGTKLAEGAGPLRVVSLRKSPNGGIAGAGPAPSASSRPSVVGSNRSGSSNSYGPSFDCNSKPATTQPVAQMICKSPALSFAELSYVIAYQAVKESSNPQDQKRLVDDANALVMALNDDCGLPSAGPIQRAPTAKEVACIGAHFQQQRNALITQSSGWAHEEATLEPRQTVEIHRGLQARGYLSASDTVDGVFGPVTRRAIRAWQQDNGVSATGFGSRVLLAALNGALGATSVSQQAPQNSSVPTLPATTRDRSGKTNSIQLVLGESTELRPQEVFAKAANAVYVVETTEAIGSAVAISEHELLTNCHVVKDAPMVALIRQGDKQAARVTSANADADRCILTVSGTLPTWVKVRP